MWGDDNVISSERLYHFGDCGLLLINVCCSLLINCVWSSEAFQVERSLWGARRPVRRWLRVQSRTVPRMN